MKVRAQNLKKNDHFGEVAGLDDASSASSVSSGSSAAFLRSSTYVMTTSPVETYRHSIRWHFAYKTY